MIDSQRMTGFRAAREWLDHVVRDMERFIMNLDPGRGQVLRNWLREIAVDRPSAPTASPPVAGWPLAEQLGDHVQAVIAARTAVRKARSLLGPSGRKALDAAAGAR